MEGRNTTFDEHSATYIFALFSYGLFQGANNETMDLLIGPP